MGKRSHNTNNDSLLKNNRSHPMIPDERQDKRTLLRLLRAIERRDSDEINQAFETIYHTYVRLVAFVCGKYLADDEDIKLVTNDVFVYFFNHLQNLSSKDSGLKYYLTVTAKHASLNYIRDQKRHADALMPTDNDTDALLAIPDPDGEDPGASLRYKELVRDLSACMDQTSLDIVLRHAVMGETFPVIGNHLHLKTATVKTMYHRALAAFRREKGAHWS